MKNKLKDLCVVIAAGGSSNRFGKNKLFLDLCGLPVFIHSIKNFLEVIEDKQIILVVNKNEVAKFADSINKYLPGLNIKIVIGGKTRMHSVINSLSIIPKIYKYVAIHDAARPFANKSLLLDCFKQVLKYGAVIPAKKIVDTLKKGENNLVQKTVPRDNLYAVETPQIFLLENLIKGYKQVIENNIEVTDDASIYEFLKKDIYIHINNENNIKITYPNDLDLAKSMIKKLE